MYAVCQARAQYHTTPTVSNCRQPRPSRSPRSSARGSAIIAVMAKVPSIRYSVGQSYFGTNSAPQSQICRGVRVDPLVAELALTEASTAKRRVDGLVRTAMAVPLRLLALAWIVLCPIALLVGRNHLGPAVGIALLAVTAVSGVRYRQVAHERGVRAHLWPWLAVAVIALGGGAAASRAGTGHGLAWLNIAGPFVVNALALLALAGFVRSRAIGIAAVTMLAMSFIVAGTLSGTWPSRFSSRHTRRCSWWHRRGLPDDPTSDPRHRRRCASAGTARHPRVVERSRESRRQAPEDDA